MNDYIKKGFAKVILISENYVENEKQIKYSDFLATYRTMDTWGFLTLGHALRQTRQLEC
jgi:hypothetical protein